MPNRDIVVVGASSGGMQALKTLVAQLPANFPAAVFIARHVAPDHSSFLAETLQRATTLPVSHATDGEPIETGRIYVSSADRHLLVEKERVLRVTHGPKENRFRPSVDVLFRSAAAAFGRRVVGVVLTGYLDDGASGLYAIKERGGIAVVQDPVEAEYPDMPLNAMRAVKVDYAVSLTEMGNLLTKLVSEPIEEKEESSVSKNMKIEVEIAKEKNAIQIGSLELGEKTSFTCPDCHGSLVEIKEGDLTRFRCHTGHAYTLNTLLNEVGENIENALWLALNKIEESEMLLNRALQLFDDAEQSKPFKEIILRQAKNAAKKAKLVRQALLNKQINGDEKSA